MSLNICWSQSVLLIDHDNRSIQGPQCAELLSLSLLLLPLVSSPGSIPASSAGFESGIWRGLCLPCLESLCPCDCLSVVSFRQSVAESAQPVCCWPIREQQPGP